MTTGCTLLHPKTFINTLLNSFFFLKLTQIRVCNSHILLSHLFFLSGKNYTLLTEMGFINIRIKNNIPGILENIKDSNIIPISISLLWNFTSFMIWPCSGTGITLAITEVSQSMKENVFFFCHLRCFSKIFWSPQWTKKIEIKKKSGSKSS